MTYLFKKNAIKKAQLKFKEKIWLAFLGLPFSFFGSAYVLKFGGNFYPEIFILAWLGLSFLFFNSRFVEINGFAKKRSFYLLLILFLMLSMLGLFRDDADVLEYYARLRAFLLFVVAAYIGYYAQKSDKYDLYLELLLWLCLGVILFNFFHMILVSYVQAYSVSSSIKITFSILAYAIVIDILSKKGDNFFAFVLVLFLIVSSSLSFFRQFYFVSFLITLYFIVVVLMTDRNTKRKKIFISAIGLVLILLMASMSGLVWGGLIEFLSSSEGRYIHSIGKLNDLLSLFEGGEVSESEGNRLMGFQYLFTHFAAYALPNGLVNDKFFIMYSTWGGEGFKIDGVSIIRDSMFAYFVVLFGFYFLLLFILFGLYLTFMSLVNSSIVENSSVLLFFMLFWLLFFIDGTLVTQFEKALFTGAVVSFAFPFSGYRRLG